MRTLAPPSKNYSGFRPPVGTMIVHTTSADQTQALGQRLGRLLRGGDLVCLYGELGSGKTTLTRGLARGAGSRVRVLSPTFGLVRVYRASCGPVYHIDLYRVVPKQTRNIGLEEYLGDPCGIAVVEWPMAAEEYYPQDRLEVNLSHVARGRRLRFRARGPRSREILRRLEQK